MKQGRVPPHTVGVAHKPCIDSTYTFTDFGARPSNPCCSFGFHNLLKVLTYMYTCVRVKIRCLRRIAFPPINAHYKYRMATLPSGHQLQAAHSSSHSKSGMSLREFMKGLTRKPKLVVLDVGRHTFVPHIELEVRYLVLPPVTRII